MPYTNVQFIAYVIDTAPEEHLDGSQTYLGLPNPQQDIEARCVLMTRAIQEAQANLPQASPPEAPGTTLKVFLAPEFFFRGATGAYQMDDVQFAITTLQAIAAADEWADWVFGFGTILGTSAPATGSPPVVAPDATHEIYNFTLIQKGGTASQGHSGARVVMKELMSGIDFIAANANPGGMLLGDVEHLAAAAAGGPGREQQRVDYDGAGIFDLDGITWAVEICLDYSGDVQRLQRSPQRPGASQVQLQLVPSCGMSIQDASVIAKPGGYIFNCDGLNGGHSALRLVGPPNVAVAGTGPYPVDDSDIPLAGTSPIQDVPVSDLYQDGAGTVMIYPAAPVPVPAAGTVGGQLTQLLWPASTDYQFKFDLIYGDDGVISTVLCEAISLKTNFNNNNYFLPLYLSTKSREAVRAHEPDDDVEIDIDVGPGTGGFDRAVWCAIHVPGFDFEGNAFQFNDHMSGAAPETVW